MEEIKFVILNSSDIDKKNFDEVLETSKETTRKSIDLSKILISFKRSAPESLQTLSILEGPYTLEQTWDAMETPEWKRVLS